MYKKRNKLLEGVKIMKMLKRAGAIAIAGAMALSLGSVAYAADPTITVGKINIGEADANGIATVTVPYTTANLAEGAQVTLLAELGAKEGVYAESIVYETTAYIDQDAAGSEFTFKINQSRLVGDKDADVWLNVKVGGTGVATAAEGSVLAYDYKEVVDPITSEMVGNALLKVDGNVETGVFGLDNASIMRLDVQSLVADKKLDLATHVVKIDGVEAAYTVYNDVTKLVALVDTTVANHTVEIVAKDGGAKEIKYGDLSGDLAYSPADLSLVITKILETAALTDINDLSRVIGDVNGDVSISPADMSLVISLILDTDGTIVPDANNK